MKNLFMLAFCFFVLRPSVCAGSALGDLAASMKAGEWRELPTIGLDNDTLLYMTVNGPPFNWGGRHTDWSNYLAWNPGSEEIIFLGARHLMPFGFVRYSAATNRWRNDSDVPACMKVGEYSGCFNHGYDCGTIDQENGVFYYNSQSRFFGLNISSQQWTEWTQSQGRWSERAPAVAYFPPLKKIAWVLGTYGELRLVDPVTKVSETVTSSLTSTLGYQGNTMEYSPAHRKLYFGGGGSSRALYSMDSAKNVTRLADAPSAFVAYSSSLAVDPVTGAPLLLTSANQLYAYSAASNTWTQQNSPPTKLMGVGYSDAITATGVAGHGVVFYLSPGLSKVYLYKHAAGTNTEMRVLPQPGVLSVLPNPAKHSAAITWQGAPAQPLRLAVYDSRGRQVADLTDGIRGGRAEWDASRFPAGIYMVEAVNGNSRNIRKIAITR